MGKSLVVFYSRKGENYYNKEIKFLEKGNTAVASEFIKEAVGADVFEVDTVKPYAQSYQACVQEAVAEFKNNARPEIKGYVEDMSEYDTIFVGYPCWCGTFPMCLFTFLEHYDFTGKTIVPFCTNEGSGLGNSINDLNKICQGATIAEGLSIRGCEVNESKDMIVEWAKKNVQ